MRSAQNQAKHALRTGVWSDGKKLSKEEFQQIRDGIQVLEEDIAEASACSLPAQSSSTSSSTTGNQSSSVASNCPSEYSWPFSAGCGSKLRVLPNGHLLHNGCPEAGDPWKDEGQIDAGSPNDRRGLGWPGLDEFYECHLAARKGNSLAANSVSPSKEAEQIPNCPPTLPPSCVTWSEYDQQLQLWNLTNNCGRDVSVTFRSEGALENTKTFGIGESYRAKWRGSKPPKQIVWDAAKGVGFYHNKPAGAALKCQSSLPL